MKSTNLNTKEVDYVPETMITIIIILSQIIISSKIHNLNIIILVSTQQYRESKRTIYIDITIYY